MQVWSLSSGSSGNCYLVREGETLLLMEAGLSVAHVESELCRLGIALSEVDAVLVTHEHTDHWSSAAALARRAQAPLMCSAGTWRAGAVASRAVVHQPLVAGQAVQVGSMSVETFRLPHDAAEPVGFHLRSSRAALCLATDMGTATEEAMERAGASDLVILESNHDVDMVLRGPYPAPLKARILGDRGHLSNDEAGRSLVRLAGGRPRHVWLAHLSHTNNSPRMALATVQAALRQEGLNHLQVAVALRDRRSLFWDSEADHPFEQLRLL